MNCLNCGIDALKDYSIAFVRCEKCEVTFLKAEIGWNENIERKEVGSMAEQKAVPLNVVVSDKGQKSKRIGKAFVNLDGKVPLSITIALEDLRMALKDNTVTEQDYKSNPQYPDQVLDGKKVVRMAGFKITKRSSI